MTMTGDIVLCFGGSRPTATNFARVHGTDEDIFKILKRRQERSTGRKVPVTHIQTLIRTSRRPGVRELEEQVANLQKQRRIVANQRDSQRHLAVLDAGIQNATNRLERLRARREAS